MAALRVIGWLYVGIGALAAALALLTEGWAAFGLAGLSAIVAGVFMIAIAQIGTTLIEIRDALRRPAEAPQMPLPYAEPRSGRTPDQAGTGSFAADDRLEGIFGKR